ncbi:hypothetical protein BGX27_008330 [Mortierella sp. AM989]|nr:hypothetical protein BGX27_008330 [Mortierella sp. AM989]
MSPVSRQAKLVHLIGYVDRQRELVSSEDEAEQEAVEKTSKMTLTKSGRLVPVTAELIISPLSAPQRQQESRQFYTLQRTVPDALDPCLALPRALPRRSSEENPYRDSVYNGIDVESEYQCPRDSIYDYSYGSKEHALVYESSSIQDWRQDLSQVQRPPRRFNAFARPTVFRSQTTEEFDLQKWPLVRRPTVESMERSSKPGRLGGFSSFLTKGRRQRLRRRGSHPALERKNDFEDSDSVASKDQGQFHTIAYKSGRALKVTMMGSSGDSEETQSEDLIKPRSTVKQMFLDVFKKSSGKPGPEAASAATREEQLHPEFQFESYEKQERQLFSLWSPPHVELEDDEDETSSSDQSPRTLQSPWTPGTPSSSTTLRHSASFNRLFPYLDDCSKAEEAAGYEGNAQKSMQPSDQLVPIAALIRELTTFGLDYVNHNPCSSQRMMEHEQTTDFQSAGNYVVAAM